MQMRLSDKIRFAVIFFKSLWTDTDTLNAEITLSEDGTYLLNIDDERDRESEPGMMYG